VNTVLLRGRAAACLSFCAELQHPSPTLARTVAFCWRYGSLVEIGPRCTKAESIRFRLPSPAGARAEA
jgi:hypothetical protein